MMHTDEFIKELILNLYSGKFGILFPRIKTRLKYAETGETSITYKDDDGNGFIIFYSPSLKTCDLKYRGKRYLKILQKIQKVHGNLSIRFNLQEIEAKKG
ncbi:MAG: hypothetical protein ACTSSI_00185 [Candidatus Helarchaeota archaeon]